MTEYKTNRQRNHFHLTILKTDFLPAWPSETSPSWGGPGSHGQSRAQLSPHHTGAGLAGPSWPVYHGLRATHTLRWHAWFLGASQRSLHRGFGHQVSTRLGQHGHPGGKTGWFLKSSSYNTYSGIYYLKTSTLRLVAKSGKANSFLQGQKGTALQSTLRKVSTMQNRRQWSPAV